MSDRGLSIEGNHGPSRLVWFVAGALTIVMLLAALTFAAPFLQPLVSGEAESGERIIIEGY